MGGNGPKIDKNCNFWAKNTSIDLYFGYMVYLGDFYWFPKLCKFSPKLPDFWAKNTRFFADAAKIWEKKLRRKVYAFLGKRSNWLNFWYKCTLGYPLGLHIGIFLFLFFCLFIGPNSWKNGFFCYYFAIFYEKKPFFHELGPIKR